MTQPPQSQMTAGTVVLILSLLLGIQPVTTDLYLPALPVLTETLGAPIAQGQLTLSALLLAFGCSQLVWGPLSDRFGRRPILLVGLCLYTVAAIGSTIAGSMTALVIWRALQGAAMGASVVCARAIVRDLYTPETAARVMSKGLSGLGVLACIGPPLGGLLTDLFGWRAALSALAMFGLLALWAVAFKYTETVREPNTHALRPRVLLETWRHILGTPAFWSYSLLTAAAYGGLFTFLAASSFVLIEIHGVSRSVYGLLVSTMAAAYLAGTFLCRRLLMRYGVQRTVALGGVFSLVGGALFSVLALGGVLTVWAIMLPTYVFMIGHGIHQPCGQSGTVAPFPRAAGAASAMGGFLMMIVAFGMGVWLGRSMDGTVFPLTNGMGFWGVVIAAIAWGMVWRTGGRGGKS